MDRIATQTSLAQIDRLEQVDGFYTQMLKVCGIGMGLGLFFYGVLVFGSGSL